MQVRRGNDSPARCRRHCTTATRSSLAKYRDEEQCETVPRSPGTGRPLPRTLPDRPASKACHGGAGSLDVQWNRQQVGGRVVLMRCKAITTTPPSGSSSRPIPAAWGWICSAPRTPASTKLNFESGNVILFLRQRLPRFFHDQSGAFVVSHSRNRAAGEGSYCSLTHSGCERNTNVNHAVGLV